MLNFKDNNILEIPKWLANKDASLMLWAGDCIHFGVTDVDRLPGYDVYLCYGFDGLDVNVNAIVNNGQEKLICVIDIHNEQQLNKFVHLFKNKFQTINSDYLGNTPNLTMETYRDLLKRGGTAYNTEGINAVFFPTIAFRDTLELLAPVLPEELKPRRKWTKEILELARDNRLSVEATWTSPDLHISYYDEIRKDQIQFDQAQALRYPGQILYHLKYTADTIEEYWDTLPDHVFLVTPRRGLSWESLDDEWVQPFKARLIAYLENKVKKTMTEAEKEDFSQYYATLNQSPDEQLSGLHRAVAAVIHSKKAIDGLRPTIRFYDDSRKDGKVFGNVWSHI
jgi:hypothetical protein